MTDTEQANRLASTTFADCYGFNPPGSEAELRCKSAVLAAIKAERERCIKVLKQLLPFRSHYIELADAIRKEPLP